jgi:signal transduction histidine kinase
VSGFSPTLLALAPLTSAVVCFGVAAIIWFGRLRMRAGGPTFAPVAVCVGLWNLGSATAMSLPNAETAVMWISKATLIIVAASGFYAMRFAVHFARIEHGRRFVVMSAVVTALAGALVLFDPELIAGVIRPSWGGLYPRLGAHWWLYMIIAFIGVLAPAALMLRLRLGMAPSRRRRQADYVILSYLSACTGGIDIFGALGADLPPMASASSMLSVAIFYYAMARYRLLDMRTAVHRTLLWVGVITFAALPIYGFARLTEGWTGWQEPVPRIAAVVGLMLLLLVWLSRLEPLAMSFITRRALRQAHVVTRFAARAVDVARPGALVPLVDEALLDLAGLRFAAIALGVDTGGQRLDLCLPEGTVAPPGLVERAQLAEPMARGELEPGEQAPAADRDAAALLDAFGADGLLPLRHGDVAVGVLAVRAPKGRVLVLDESTRAALARLGARVAVAFINAALEEGLARRSDRLAEEVDERTRALAQTVDDLKAAQAQLVQAERQSSLGVLVAGVSHEINNALNFIFANLPMMAQYIDDYAELLGRASGVGATPRAEIVRRADEARARLPQLLADVEAAALGARSIVGDLRRLARADESERRSTDVHEGLTSTLSLLAAELAGHAEVRRQLAPGPLIVDGFAAALNHVFLNVLLNAVQAAPTTGAVIRVATRALAGGGAEITIADNGPGVPEALRERVFEPFFSTRPGAAGLGLAVSRQIAVRHGGSLALGQDPELGGARVTITLGGPVAV